MLLICFCSFHLFCPLLETGPDLPTYGPQAKLISGSFLRDKLVSVGPQIPVSPRPMGECLLSWLLVNLALLEIVLSQICILPCHVPLNSVLFKPCVFRAVIVLCFFS